MRSGAQSQWGRTGDSRCIRLSRCCSFTSVVPTTALQATLVLSRPRTIAGYQHLELFVLSGSMGRPGECREDREKWKSHRSTMRVASTTCRFDRHLQIFAPPCPHMPGGSCCKQLHQMRGHGRAVVAMHGRNGRSSSMRFEVHSALPMLLLHFSGVNYCATGDTGLVRTQGDRGAPTVKVDRAHRQCGEAQRVSRGPKRVEIAPISDERVLHITPFRSAPTNVYTSVSLHARGMMQQAAASNVSPWACCHGDTWTERQV